jgi:hypothetical protein
MTTIAPSSSDLFSLIEVTGRETTAALIEMAVAILADPTAAMLSAKAPPLLHTMLPGAGNRAAAGVGNVHSTRHHHAQAHADNRDARGGGRDPIDGRTQKQNTHTPKQ